MRYAIFGVTALLTAAAVVLLWVSTLSQYPWVTLPRSAREGLRTAPSDPRALIGHAFAGLVEARNQRHWVRVSGVERGGASGTVVENGSPQLIRLEMTLANGAGSPAFAGWIDPATGALHAYIESASSRFSEFRRVEGRIMGPAIVDGVPTLYLEATPVSTSRVTAGRHEPWVGLLIAEKSP